jgi:hypothetical protein
MQSQVDESIDVIFAPPSTGDFADQNAALDADEPPELLSDGTADLGAIAAEFLLLGIDPYPRNPGAEFAPPSQENAAASPFAALAKLREGKQ